MAKAPQRFGGAWTLRKLDIFGNYISAYRTIFDKNERARYLKTIYVDAFAGSGSFIPNTKIDNGDLTESTQALVDGSTRIALNHTPGFDEYVFVELNKVKAQALEELRGEFPHHADKIKVERGDANDVLTRFCSDRDWQKTRAVVFLDPFGMQVDWNVVEALGATKAVDLWYLFPIGTMNRLLTKDGQRPDAWSDKLTKILGTPDWETAFYAPLPQQGLFSEQVEHGKNANWDSMSAFVVERLAQAFGSVVQPILLKNSQNTPLFMLCFACANLKGAEVASRIARHLMKEEK